MSMIAYQIKNGSVSGYSVAVNSSNEDNDWTGFVVTDTPLPSHTSTELILPNGDGTWRVVPNPKFAVKPVTYKTRKLNQGEFRLLFTFAERALETGLTFASTQVLNNGYPTPADVINIHNVTIEEQAAIDAFNNAVVFMTMRGDFADAGEINLRDPAVGAALDFMIAFGIITTERKAEIVLGKKPSGV